MTERDPGDDLRADPPEDPAPQVAPAADRPGSRLRLAALGLVVVAVLAVVGWVGASLLNRGAQVGGEVPLIAADPTPVKQRPEEPGGDTVPNQGMLVYGTINPEPEAEVVERLLPPPEEPEPLPVEPAGVTPPAETVEPGEGVASGEATGDVAGAGEPAAATSDAGEEDGIASLLEESQAEMPAEAVPETEGAATAAVQDEVPVPAAAPEPPPAQAAGGWRVQIAAFKERAQAEAEWGRLAQRQADLLGGLPFAIEDVDLGSDKGIYHRLQVGAFAERGEADALCAQLKTRKVDCLVIKR